LSAASLGFFSEGPFSRLGVGLDFLVLFDQAKSTIKKPIPELLAQKQGINFNNSTISLKRIMSSLCGSVPLCINGRHGKGRKGCVWVIDYKKVGNPFPKGLIQ
jgi:hypothetical protein